MNYKTCSNCGAENNDAAKTCWICNELLTGNPRPASAKPRSHRRRSSSAAALTGGVLVAALIVLIGTGLFLENSAFGLLFTLLVLPIVIAIMGFSFRSARKKGFGEPFVGFGVALGLTTVFLLLVVSALIGCATCIKASFNGPI